MSIAASIILDRCRLQLIDAAKVRWTDAELLKWLSDGQRTLVSAVPAASSKRGIVTLVAGTLQSLPSDAHMLLNPERNTNVGGTVIGRAVTLIPVEVLNAFNPNWHTDPSSAVVKQVAYNPDMNTEFYVWPPNTGTAAYLQVSYSALPTELAALSDVLTVQTIYQTALVDYVMFRAHQKDSDYAAGPNIAATYLQSFMAAVGAGEAGQVGANPNLRMVPPDITQRGAAK